MDLIQWAALIFDIGPEKARGKLVLQLLEAPPVRAPEIETDHLVFEYTIDKCVDDPPNAAFAPQLLEIIFRHDHPSGQSIPRFGPTAHDANARSLEKALKPPMTPLPRCRVAGESEDGRRYAIPN